MKQYVFDLAINADEYMMLYAGTVRDVVATSRTGERVRFPGNLLRKFVLHNGVNGTFEITVNANNKFQAIRRL